VPAALLKPTPTLLLEGPSEGEGTSESAETPPKPRGGDGIPGFDELSEEEQDLILKMRQRRRSPGLGGETEEA